MAVEFVSNTIHEPRRRQLTEAAVRAGIRNREGDYAIRVLESGRYEPWLFEVQGPERTFSREFLHPFEKDASFIRNYFE